MKSHITYYIIILTLAITACHNHADGHVHADGSTHSDHSHSESEEKSENHNDEEIHLNLAQYENAEIDTGWFEKKNLSGVVNASGYTKLDPQDEADVSLPVSGIVKDVKVIEGNYVRKGQTLAIVRSIEFSKMKLAKAQLEEELKSHQANLPYLEQENERQKMLAKEEVSAQKKFQKTTSDLAIIKSKIESIKEQIDLQSEILEMIGPRSSSNIPITAPISGYITDVEVKIGSHTDPEQKMFSIVDNSKMHVDLLVYEKDLQKIQKGQTVRFILTNQSNQEIKGEIYNIGRSFENESKSVAVHADIEKNDANLIPGMYINALIDINSKTVNTLPEEAIVLAEGREFIFLWSYENSEEAHNHAHATGQDHNHDEIIFERLEVKTGSRQLGHVEVIPLGDIPPGSKIVKSGAYYLQSHLQKSAGGGGHGHAH